jgi:hypothetical protein
MSDNTDNVDDTVDSILNQLKSVPSLAKTAEKSQTKDISPEDLEKFIIQYTSRLVENATESVEFVKDNVQMAPSPEDVVSLAELIKSTSGALEVLNKMVINKAKNKTSVQIKEMDIANKKQELDTKVNLTLTASREEMMKRLFSKVDVIDITDESKSLED